MSKLRGRFDAEVDEVMQRVSSSLTADLEMASEDVEGSIAHVAVLADAGLLMNNEPQVLREGLERIRAELEEGSWRPDPAVHEDIHMAVEARLVELVGEPGRRLHTARSRNDQVATDVRLWLRRRLEEVDRTTAGLLATLLDRVESDGRTLMPGYTHLQRGQPILLGHHLLAHAWALSRDRERLAGALERVDRCPLGAGALAGTPHPIDRQLAAELLGFPVLVENAMDAVSARDHLQETAAACAILMAGLSRMAEELVLWSSAEIDFVRLSDRHTTGSSIMPQKRNPDGAELVRGKAGRVFGDLQALLVLLKGLPLAYNRDLQEEREPLQDVIRQTLDSLRLMSAMWKHAEVRRERFAASLRGDFALATELADALVQRGVPFRDAHEAVARMVRWCEEQGDNLSLLDHGRGAALHPALPEDLGNLLDPAAAVARRTSRGGTCWPEVERQVQLLRKTLPG